MRMSCPLLFVLSLLFCPIARAQDPCARELDAVARAVVDELDAADDARSELARRARWSGLMPSVRIGVRRGFGQGLSGAYVDEVQSSSRLTLDASWSFDVGLSFSLDRLVFAPEESAQLRAAEARARERDAMIGHALELFTRWLELDASADRIARHTLGARLDAMTRGRFGAITQAGSRCLDRAPEPRRGRAGPSEAPSSR